MLSCFYSSSKTLSSVVVISNGPHSSHLRLVLFSSLAPPRSPHHPSKDKFEDLFARSAFCKLSPKAGQAILIDKSKGFLPYASFLKRPIPSIHGKHVFGTISALPQKIPKKNSKIAISLKEATDGKSFFFDAPFGEIKFTDRTADYLRYKFLESLSMTIGVTHVKRKPTFTSLAPTESPATKQLENNLLLEHSVEEDKQNTFFHQLSQNADRSWKEKMSKVISKEEVFKLSSTPHEPSIAKRYFIYQLPKPFHGPLVHAPISTSATSDLPITVSSTEDNAASMIDSASSNVPSATSAKSLPQTDGAKLWVRGKIVGFVNGAQGYAVSVAGWIAYLPSSPAFLQQLQADLTPMSFLSKFMNVPLDCLYVKSCLLDTDSGTPLITLSVDTAAITRMLQEGQDISQEATI